jgi:hypothetical protein
MSQPVLQRPAPAARSIASGLHPTLSARGPLLTEEIMAMMSKKSVLAIAVGVATFGLGALNSAVLAQDRQSARPSNSSSNYDTFRNATPPVSADNNSNNRGAQARERDHRTKRETRSEQPRRPDYGRAYDDRYYGNDNGYGSHQDRTWRSRASGWRNGWSSSHYGADPYWGGNANGGEYAYWTYNNGVGYAPYYGNGYAPY